MKKLLLLLSVGVFVTGANAQKMENSSVVMTSYSSEASTPLATKWTNDVLLKDRAERMASRARF